LAEGVHFTRRHFDPWTLGARAAAANLSDLAAMGALPRAFLVSLALPRGLGRAWVADFHKGLHAWMAAFGAVPAGGDLSASQAGVFVDVTAVGEVERGRALRRSGARAGDLLYVSGPLGGSAAGLALLQKRVPARDLAPGERVGLIKRHRLPVPRVLAGRWLLLERAANAAIDVSDGLASELWHLSRESGLRVDLDLEAVPLAPGSAAVAQALGLPAWGLALRGGEDYELLFAVPPHKAALVERKLEHDTGCRPTRIGRFGRGRGVRAHDGRRWRAVEDEGYEHRLG
jgi:thiamine-monophosphate kinase